VAGDDGHDPRQRQARRSQDGVQGQAVQEGVQAVGLQGQVEARGRQAGVGPGGARRGAGAVQLVVDALVDGPLPGFDQGLSGPWAPRR
jgi:hypothetical protein